MRRYVWILLPLFFLLFSLSPSFYELSRGKFLHDRTFELVHNYYTDYNFYLSRIREGHEGRVTVVERYTAEPHKGSFIQVFYVVLGWISRVIPDAAAASAFAYHGSRIVLGGVLLFLTVFLCRNLFPSFLFQTMAFFLVVTASTWPKWETVGGFLRFGGYMPWWTIMDSLQRITFLPHLLFGQILALFLVMVGSNVSVMSRHHIWMLFGIVAFVLGMVFPPGLLFVGATYIVMIIIEAIWQRKRFVKQGFLVEFFHTSIMPRMLIGIMSFPTLLYFQLMFSFYPWKRLVEFDALHPLPFKFFEYMQALGPTLPLGLVGFLLVLRKKDKKFLPFIAWIVGWIVLLCIFSFIPQQSPSRFSELAPQIPLGILTAYVFWEMWRMRRGKIYGSLIKVFSLTIAFVVILLGVGVMVSSFFWQKDFIDQKIRAGWPAIAMNNYIVYPLATFTDGLRFIEMQTPKDSVIFSALTTGNYIPAYTGRTVYVGHDNTVDKEGKTEKMRQFFQMIPNEEEAAVFLMRNHITHIFWGPEEKELSKGKEIGEIYPFLKEIFRNRDVIIYQYH